MPPPRPQPVARAAAEEKPFARGFGAGIGLALGVGLVSMALLLVSLLGTGLVARAAGGARADMLSTTQHLWGPANASNTMLALNISGAIEGAGQGSMFATGTYGYEIAEQLDALGADDYSGVLLLMDTPGGSIYGSRAIADAVIRYQERTGNKVVAYVQSVAASGGMYAMAPADAIISDYGTFVGSIGVIFGPFERYRDVTGLTGNILTSGVETEGGITQEYLTRGTAKDFGNPFRDMTDEERAVYEGMDVGTTSSSSSSPSIAASRDRIRDELGAHVRPDHRDRRAWSTGDGTTGRLRGASLNEGPGHQGLPRAAGRTVSLLGAEQRSPGHNIPLSSNDDLRPTARSAPALPPCWHSRATSLGLRLAVPDA